MVNLPPLLKWVGGALTAVCVAAPATLWLEVSRLERPSYHVIKTIRAGRVKAEVRQYEPYLIAESAVNARTMKEGTAEGFMNIASYIFGDNTPRGKIDKEGRKVEKEKVAMTAPVRLETSEKVAMTSPVRTELSGGSLRSMKVSFVMPRKYNKDTLPTPKNKKVAIKTVPGHRMVAIRFSGPVPREAKISEMSDVLFDVLQRESLTPKGDLMVYGYHPPFMPGFLRRNEVAVKV